MNRKANGHSTEFIKRQANKLKRREGIPLHLALDKVAISLGFINYKDFIKKSSNSKQSNFLKQKPAESVALTRSSEMPVFDQVETFENGVKQIPSGTLVKIKNSNLLAIIILHDIWNDHILVYSDKGRDAFGRSDITVFRDQSEARNFVPMRLRLPYGMWNLNDGSQVLFNRDYYPIWYRSINGEVSKIDPETNVPHRSEEFYFNDGSTPWSGRSSTKQNCLNISTEWGVSHRKSTLNNLLSLAIEVQNLNGLKLKKQSKAFS